MRIYKTKQKLDIGFRKDILAVADFSTKVRSGVITDFKRGHVAFVPQTEMPMRMTTQLYGISMGFMVMNHHDNKQVLSTIEKMRKENIPRVDTLNEDDRKILYKIAFTSIPVKRRKALMVLAKHQTVTTAGLATFLNYHTDVVKSWLYQLNGLDICKREKGGGQQGDKWTLNPEYRIFLERFEGVVPTNDVLEGEAEEYNEEHYEQMIADAKKREEKESQKPLDYYGSVSSELLDF